MGCYAIAAASAALLSGCSLLDATSDGNASSSSGDAALPHDDGSSTGCLIVDDFEDGVTGPLWDPFDDPEAHVREVDGAVEVSFTGAQDPRQWAGYSLASDIDLTEGEVRAEVRAAGGGYTGLSVWLGDMVIDIFADELTSLVGEVSATPESDDYGDLPYDPAVHRFWRIRTDDGIVYWEASQDQQTWHLVHVQPIPFSLEAVTVLIESGGVVGDPAATFESFSARPTGCEG